MKKNNGITLIALVITIIVLLILAGVSIAMITSQDGILGKAKGAKADSALGTAKDVITNSIAAGMAEYYDLVYVQNNKDATLIGCITDEIDKVKTSVTGVTIEYADSSDNTKTTVTLTYDKDGSDSKAITGDITKSTGSIEWK